MRKQKLVVRTEPVNIYPDEDAVRAIEAIRNVAEPLIVAQFEGSFKEVVTAFNDVNDALVSIGHKRLEIENGPLVCPECGRGTC